MRKGGGVKRSIIVYGVWYYAVYYAATFMCTCTCVCKSIFLGIRMTLSNRPPTLHVHVKVLLLHENKHSMKMIGIADLIINK